MGRPKKIEEYIPNEVEQNVDISKDVLGELLSNHKKEHFNDIVPKRIKISSSSIKLDSLISVKSGDVIRLVGKGYELGKTSQAFVFAGNYMSVMPKSKTLFIKAEGRLSEELQKRTGHKFVTNSKDWDYGTVFVLSCNIFEVVAEFVETLLSKMYDQGEHLCVIIDSLDGLILRNDSSKKIWKEKESPKVAGVPLLTKLLFRRIGLPLEAYDGLLLVTGQYSAEIKLDTYSSQPLRQGPSSGGSNIGHQASYIIAYSQRFMSDFILEDKDAKPDPINNKILGVNVKLEIQKSATDSSFTKCEIPIKKGVVGCAIWQSREIGDCIVDWPLAKLSGAWIYFNDEVRKRISEIGIELPEKVNGKNALYDFLEENKKACDWFYQQFTEIFSKED